MLKTTDILDEKEKILRTKSKEVTFPLDNEEKKAIDDMMTYLLDSQDEEKAEKYNLRPGMGMSAIQLGIPKRIFVMAMEMYDKSFKKRIFINPEIVSYSSEMIYVEESEGCLSVNRPVFGIIPRHARVTLKYFNEKGEEVVERFRELESVLIEHELDHLEGILFVDRIDPKNPFKDISKYRAI